ncbi:hypothetical protein GCM10010404_57930 [Nonomuraea africana]
MRWRRSLGRSVRRGGRLRGIGGVRARLRRPVRRTLGRGRLLRGRRPVLPGGGLLVRLAGATLLGRPGGKRRLLGLA